MGGESNSNLYQNEYAGETESQASKTRCNKGETWQSRQSMRISQLHSKYIIAIVYALC